MWLKKLLFIVCVFVFSLKNVFAFGLNVSPGQFVIENLRIGQSYDLTKMSQPFVISFFGAKNMDMAIDIFAPDDPLPGYEPIPDKNWVKLDKEVYSATADEKVNVTAVLTIPDDEKYLGKKYDVRLRVSLKPTLGPATFGVNPGVEVRMLFSIYKEKGSVEDNNKFEKAIESGRNISFLPLELNLKDVPIGRKVDIKKEFKKSLKITNLNEDAISVKIKCILPKDVGATFPAFESLDNLNEVKLSTEKLKVSSNQIDEVKLYLDFPDKPEYHRRNFYVFCEASVENTALSTQYRTRIFITTK